MSGTHPPPSMAEWDELRGRLHQALHKITFGTLTCFEDYADIVRAIEQMIDMKLHERDYKDPDDYGR